MNDDIFDNLGDVFEHFNKAEAAKFDQERKDNNQKLVDILQKLVNDCPTQRFSQILRNAGFVKETRPASPEARVDWQNEFYAEPQDILKRVKERVKDIEGQRTTTKT